jgi:transposase
MRPLFIRELSSQEKKVLQKGLHSSEAFTVRRSQILLSSAQGRTPRHIAKELHLSDQCVRNAIHAFNKQGPSCLEEKSHARHDNQSAFDKSGLEHLREIIRLSPRTFGHEASIWTLELLAKSCWEKRVTSRPVNSQNVGRALRQIGIRWSRAKHWIHSPDEHYGIKKTKR